ncbi:hypothetical protein RFI_14007 [Reticulomyxa filosa]|uniref:RRM domain-containing protein n=1 Tax=Reticulomyxa filosa TaxID=46433 RepID=X6NAW4_RETFI|nr:hypothetical protein RFI_14007 [Reticulomyxa filosa]|eukprot:ETO23181.1 hypothetical protein RFI_14007 [Reticulomyxa filosa]
MESAYKSISDSINAYTEALNGNNQSVSQGEATDDKRLITNGTSLPTSYGAGRGTSQMSSETRFDPLKSYAEVLFFLFANAIALQQMQSLATKQALANAKQQTLLAQKLKQINTYTWPGNVATDPSTYNLMYPMGWLPDTDYSAYGLNNFFLNSEFYAQRKIYIIIASLVQLFVFCVALLCNYHTKGAGAASPSQSLVNHQAAMAINPALTMGLNPLVNPLAFANPFATALQSAFTGGVSDGKQHALFVFHLPEDIDDQGLLQLFAPYGAVRANVMRQDDGRTRGFGFVHFNNKQDASIAIEMMNGHQIGRKRLMVSFKKEKNEGASNQK